MSRRREKHDDDEECVVRLYLSSRKLMDLHQAVHWADLSSLPPIARDLMKDVVDSALRLQGRRLK